MNSSPDNAIGLGLGLDAGGTQTRWALAGADGALIAQGHRAGFHATQMNSATGREAVRELLAALVHDVLTIGQPTCVRAGVTGFDDPREGSGALLHSLLAELLHLQPGAIIISNDLEVAYLDIFKPGEGYLVYAGTGSIAAYIDTSGQFHRAGGRGGLLDDAGGGYWIAREALRHIWRSEDERPGAWRDCPMAIKVFEYIGSSEWTASRHFVNSAGRGDFGKLALAVAAAADSDAAARAILRQAGEELARLAKALTARFGERPIALSGRAAHLHPLIEQAMRGKLPDDASMRLVVGQAHVAAARIAARGKWMGC